MFVVDLQPTFRHAVEVLVPTDGGHEKQTFAARFRVLASDKESEHDIATVEGSNSFLRAIVVEMDELVGRDEQPLPYNDALRDQLLKLPYIRTALVRTYFEAIQKATEGN